MSKPVSTPSACGDSNITSNASDYIRAIIREERRRREEKKLEQMLLEGINSGPGVEYGTKEWDAFWEGIHARIRHEASQKVIHV